MGPAFTPSIPSTPGLAMKLLDTLLQHTQGWRFVFPQVRSLERAIALAFGILCGVGKRTLTRAISFQGNTQKDWSADYKVFSRSPWEPRALFDPILQQGIEDHQLERIVISTDDTATAPALGPERPPSQTLDRSGGRLLLQSHDLEGRLGQRKGDGGGALPQGHCALSPSARPGTPVLWQNQVHTGASAPVGFDGAVAEGEDFSRWLFS